MIHLIRHGRSSHAHDGRWFTAPTVGRYEDAYDAAGIRDDSHPPPALVDLAARADVVAASDLARAIASVRRLAPEREPEIVPEMRELRLEPPRWVPVPLPIEVWDAMSYVQWSWRLARDADHEYSRRAGAAAHWLLSRAANGASVVAVTHGGIRRIIARHLERFGCAARTGKRTHENWSSWSYALPVTRAGSPRSG